MICVGTEPTLETVSRARLRLILRRVDHGATDLALVATTEGLRPIWNNALLQIARFWINYLPRTETDSRPSLCFFFFLI